MDKKSLSFIDQNSLLAEIPHIGWWKINKIKRGSLKAHQHKDSYEICYIHSGQVSWWVGDQVYEISGNQLYMTWPDELHGGMDDLMQKCEIYWIQFRLDKPFPGLNQEELETIREAFDNIHHRTCQALPSIKKYFDKILYEHRNSNHFSKIKVKSLAIELMLDIILAFNIPAVNNVQRHHSQEIEHALKYIHLNYSCDICIDDLSELSGLKNTQFRKRFRQEIGMTPLNYINRQRIKKAKELLVETDKDISFIAITCGYQTSQYFATVFKRFTSLSPKEFRHK